MLLTIVAQNTSHGGLHDEHGDPEDRLEALAQRLQGADIALLSEAQGWNARGHRPLATMMRLTGLTATPLAPSGTGYHTVLLYRRDITGDWVSWDPSFGHTSVHGFAAAAFDVGLPLPLTFIAVHLDPHNAAQGVMEAKTAASRAYRLGPYGVVGGDLNYPPAHGNEPDYTAMKPYNLAARTLPTDPDDPLSPPVPNRAVGHMLTRCGMTDTAWHVHQATGDESVLGITGTDDRIDQIWVTGPLTPAIVSHRQVHEPAGASDHAGVVTVIDTTKVDTGDPWEFV